MMRRRLLSFVVAAVVVAALSGCSSARSVPLTAAAVPSAPPAVIPTDVPTGDPTVVTIGDSIMKGHGLFASQAWPALMAVQKGWKLDNLACDGAGFLASGDDSDCDTTFAGLIDDTVDLTPRTVIIEGSSNDFGEDNSALLTVTESLLSQLRRDLPHAQIIGLSTLWGDTAVPAQLADINAQVAEAVHQVGGVYIDIGQPLSGHPEWMQADDVHPTARGQQAILAAVEAALTKARITP